MSSEFIYTYIYMCVYILEALMAEWLSPQKVDLFTQVQTLNEAVGISHRANTLGKSMNPSIPQVVLNK